MRNTERATPVPLAAVAVFCTVMRPGKIETAPVVILHGFSCIEAASADAVFLRLFPRSKRRFGSAVNRVDKLGKAGIGKIPGIAYLVHLAAFRTIRIACRIQRTIILPVHQILRAVQDNTAASCHRHIKPSRRDQNPVAFIFLIIKYIRITPVQLFI